VDRVLGTLEAIPWARRGIILAVAFASLRIAAAAHLLEDIAPQSRFASFDSIEAG
jgi:hypothetical protein